MKPIFSRLLVLFSGLFLLLSYSCNKDPYEIGYDLLPGSDTLNVRTVDTSTIIAYSLLHDSIRTDKRSEYLIGSIADPVFGTTTASWYTQFRLSTESVEFGSNTVLDSVVLQLKAVSLYGDTNTLQTVNVFELSQDLSYDSSYYSNHSIQTYPNLLANYTFRPNLRDSIFVGGEKVPAHIRINLTNLTHYFGNKLLSAPSDVLSSNISFLKYMKGLAIQTSPVSASGGLLSINYGHDLTKLMLYFHTNTDTTQYSFIINSLCAAANLIDHNGYQNASQDLKNQVLNKDTTLGRERLYIQGLGGIQVKVRLPYINELKKLGNIAINNASLVLQNFETDTTYKPVPTLYLVKKDTAGRIAFLVDYSEGTSYFGGTYDKTKRTYSFRITRHLEHVLQGKTDNYDLYILASSPLSTTLVPNRVTLVGTNPSDPSAYQNRLRLEVVYTKLQ